MKLFPALLLSTMLSTAVWAQGATTTNESEVDTTQQEADASVMPATATVGEQAPDFSGITANGETFKLSEHKGSIVVLEWTNDGCPFVKKHYDSGNMQKLQKEATEKGVKWVRVISSAPGKQGHLDGLAATELAEEQGVAATATVLDSAGNIGRMYDAKTTPHMFVIDKEGKLQYAGAIDDDPGVDAAKTPDATNYVTAAITALEAGQVPDVQNTKAYGCSVKY